METDLARDSQGEDGSEGYVAIAFDDARYLDIAANLALSIRRAGHRPLSVLINPAVRFNPAYEGLFDQVITVQRGGQKAIALGKGGQTIKTIGELARKEMEELFARRVHLFLFVKVREDWAEQSENYRDMGLEFPED